MSKIRCKMEMRCILETCRMGCRWDYCKQEIVHKRETCIHMMGMGCTEESYRSKMEYKLVNKHMQVGLEVHKLKMESSLGLSLRDMEYTQETYMWECLLMDCKLECRSLEIDYKTGTCKI